MMRDERKEHMDHAQDGSVSFTSLVENVESVNLGNKIVAFTDADAIRRRGQFPFRFDNMIIILVKGGRGKIGIDTKSYEISPNQLIIIQPQHYVSYSIYSDDVDVDVIACTRSVVDEILPRLSDLTSLIMVTRTNPVLTLNELQAADIHRYYQLIHDTISRPATPYQHQITLSILQTALFGIMDIIHENKPESIRPSARKDELVSRFFFNVSEHFRTERQVTYYAEQLKITPKHLSTIVKERTGETALHWIANYVIMEAKMLLKTTDLSIQEIAVQLNFPNQSFFGKYFKFHTGITPTDYRNS